MSGPIAKVRVTNGGYAMTLATYVAYGLPEGDHWLYARPEPAGSEPVAWPPTETWLNEALAKIVEVWWSPATAYFIRLGKLSVSDVKAKYVFRDLLKDYTPSTPSPEVAQIVAWLRGRFCQFRQHPEDQAFARMVADAIERGDWKP